EKPAKRVPRLIGRVLADPCGVGTHIGDETHGTLIAHLHTLVKSLRHTHGLLGAETQLLRGFLLQSACCERRSRVLATLTPLHLGKGDVFLPRQRVQHGLSGGLVRQLGLLAVHLVQLCRERLTLVQEQRRDRPVLRRDEGADLPLTLHDHPECNGLHATGGEPLLHRLPENRAGLVANETVQHTTRLLCINLELVDLARGTHTFQNLVARYLPEENAPDG